MTPEDEEFQRISREIKRRSEEDDDIQEYKKPWVNLTDEEIAEFAERMEASDPTDSFWREFSRAIERKLKEKNF